MRFVLASTSPARLTLLRSAGLSPEKMAPGVDEEALIASIESERGCPMSAPDLVQTLARAKAEAAAEVLLASLTEPTLVFGGDSAFEIGGAIHGKPHTPGRARERWIAQNGRTGTLWSGHWVMLLQPDTEGRGVGRVAAAKVSFAQLTETEIDTYIATGEPLAVAGAFTIDSLGGPFISHVEGDPSTVVGLSLSTLRELVRELGVEWTDLWAARA